jgi:spore coat-associated protein N
MSRFKVLRANPRRTLTALATLLIAVGVTAASGANFNATSANPSNTFSAGTMKILNSNEGVAIFGALDMAPGDTATGTVDIKNDGTLPGPFTLTRGAITNEHATYKLSEKLDLVITDCGPDMNCGTAGDNTTVYSGGTIAEMGTAGHSVAPLGSFAAAEEHRYQFVATLDSTVSDNYQGKGTEVQFDWSATSA